MDEASAIDPHDGEVPRAQLPTRWWRVALLGPVFVLAPILAALWNRAAIVEAFEAEGPSMEPTLLNGDRFAVAKSAYGLFLPFTSEALVHYADPEPGDVVVLHSPYDEIDILKRVIAVAGQTVEHREGVVFVDGNPLSVGLPERCPDRADCELVRERLGERTWQTLRSPYAMPETIPPRETPPGHVYVLGDHRDRSNDSRRIGPIPVGRIKGRAVVIYWSNDMAIRWDRIGTWFE